MTSNGLETPANRDDLYTALGDDATTPRPIFTGDIFSLDEEMCVIVQHPCAIRSGVSLRPNLLTCSVRAVTTKLRSDWGKHSFTESPFPNLLENGVDYIADFNSLGIVQSSRLKWANRVAVLSQFGVNIFIQRWIYHNSRVVIPTLRIDDQTYGPFNEADIAEEWLVGSASTEDTESDLDTWLRKGTPSRRQRLQDRQAASGVRKESLRELAARE